MPIESANAFSAVARGWTFRPFVVGDKPMAVCAIVAFHYPAAARDSDRDRLPRPPQLSKAGHVLYNVNPRDLEKLRVAGEKQVVPDDRDKSHLRGKRLVGSFKLCVDETGHYDQGVLLLSTGVPGYDATIARAMMQWVYHPYVVDGVAIPVCTAVTFIYTQQPADPEPTLTLVSPGKGPKLQLRMCFMQGDTHTAVIDWKERSSNGDNGRFDKPEKSAMRYEIAYEVGDVTPSGDARVDVTYRKIELAPTDDTAKELDAKIAPLANTKAHAIITARGLVKDFELAPGVPESLQDVFKLLVLRPFDEALPDEPVGVGASWQVADTVPVDSGTVALTTTYVVKAIDGGRITLDVSQDSTATGGGGVTMHETAKGKAVIDRNGFVPTSVELDITQDVNIDDGKANFAQHRTTTVTVTAR
jgi:hypothetical protein